VFLACRDHLIKFAVATGHPKETFRVVTLGTILIEDYGLPRSGPVSLAAAIPEIGVQNVWTTS